MLKPPPPRENLTTMIGLGSVLAGGPVEHRAGLRRRLEHPGAGEARGRMTAKHQKGMNPGFTR